MALRLMGETPMLLANQCDPVLPRIRGRHAKRPHAGPRDSRQGAILSCAAGARIVPGDGIGAGGRARIDVRRAAARQIYDIQLLSLLRVMVGRSRL
jgi:hypothetical protein